MNNNLVCNRVFEAHYIVARERMAALCDGELCAVVLLLVRLLVLLYLVVGIVVVILDEESPELKYLVFRVGLDNLLEVVECYQTCSYLDV